MNEFIAKKLGEVHAFALVCNETIEQGKTAFCDAFGDDEVEQVLRENRIHIDQINKIAEEDGVLDTVEQKSARTETKLRKMRDLYIGDEWDNPVELMEWSGFCEGAATAHWRIIQGAGEETGSEELTELAEDSLALHSNIFERAQAYLHEIGQSKSE